jgi:hypothetical protein
MSRKLFMTVASAALIAGLGTAAAQSPNASPKATEDAPKAAQPAQAPKAQMDQKGSAQMDKGADKAKDAAKDASKDAAKSAGDQKAMPRSAQDQKSDMPKGSAQSNEKMDATKDRAQATQKQDATKDRAQSNQKMDAQKDAQKDAQRPGATDQKGSGATTGQAASPGRGGAAVTINETQRSRIKQTINIQSAPKVTNVNFSLSVGTRVPRETVRAVVLPPTIIEIVPEYRGFLYFVVGSTIVIVDPGTYEIVTVIEV